MEDSKERSDQKRTSPEERGSKNLKDSIILKQLIIGLIIGSILALSMGKSQIGWYFSSRSLSLLNFDYWRSSDDHQSWSNWMKLQNSNPFVPNHDPNDLGVEPPEDLKERRPSKLSKCPNSDKEFGSDHLKVKLPKKLNLHHSDEL